MSVTLRERLARGGLRLDGGTGTALMARGVAPDAIASANLEAPELVAAVHGEFAEAGAELLLTNTFAAHPLALKQGGAESAAVVEAGVRIAREVAEAKGVAWVVGDLGPMGAYVPPGAPRAPEGLDGLYVAGARVLADSGVDGLLLETFGAAGEARRVMAAVREAVEVPVFVSLTFERRASGVVAADGAPLAEGLALLAAEGADAVGLNCGTGSADLLEALPGVLAAVDVPVLVRPNAGVPRESAEGLVFPERAADFAAALRRALELGAAAVGGCCGATAAHLRTDTPP